MLHRITATEAAMVELDALTATAQLPDRMFDALFDAVYGLQVKRGTYVAQRRAQGDEISDLTASRDLSIMSTAGLLVAHGEKRGRFYSAGPSLIDIRNRVGLGRARPRTNPFA